MYYVADCETTEFSHDVDDMKLKIVCIIKIIDSQIVERHCFTSEKSFEIYLNKEFNKNKKKLKIYFHNLRFDSKFVVRESAKYIIKNSTILKAITQKANFCDSLSILNASVESLGKAFNLKKLDMKSDDLKEYCLRDCEIVHLALEKTAALLSSTVEELGLTMGSEMHKMFHKYNSRYEYIDEKQRKHNIITSYATEPTPKMPFAFDYRKFYHGARCEVYNYRKFDKVFIYDINSMYAFIQTQFKYPIPPYLRLENKNGMDPDSYLLDDRFFGAECEIVENHFAPFITESNYEYEHEIVKIVEKKHHKYSQSYYCAFCKKVIHRYDPDDTNFHCEHVAEYRERYFNERVDDFDSADFIVLKSKDLKIENRLVFRNGKKTAFLFREEIEYCLSKNYHLKILTAHYCSKFDYIFDYIKDLYEKRKNSTDESERACIKSMLVRSYGKFAERQTADDYVLITEPDKQKEENLIKTGFKIAKECSNYPILYSKSNFTQKRINLVIAARVTALAKLHQQKFIDEIIDRYGSEHLIYTDTDSIFTDIEIPEWNSSELGKMKLEEIVTNFRAIGRKCYISDSSKRTKIKGVDNKLSREEKMRYFSAEGVKISRPVGFRESIRRGVGQTSVIHLYKKMRSPRIYRKLNEDLTTTPLDSQTIINSIDNLRIDDLFLSEIKSNEIF